MGDKLGGLWIASCCTQQDENEGGRVEERQRDGVESEAETERQRLARGWHLSDEMRCDS